MQQTHGERFGEGMAASCEIQFLAWGKVKFNFMLPASGSGDITLFPLFTDIT